MVKTKLSANQTAHGSEQHLPSAEEDFAPARKEFQFIESSNNFNSMSLFLPGARITDNMIFLSEC